MCVCLHVCVLHECVHNLKVEVMICVRISWCKSKFMFISSALNISDMDR